MNEFSKAVLAFLKDNAHTVLEGASGAELIRVNRATLRSRILKGQAMAMRETDGRERGRVEFTPYQLVFNMLFDGFARFNAVPSTEWIEDVTKAVFADIEAGKFDPAQMCRVVSRDGGLHGHIYSGGQDLEESTGEPCVVVPVGTMVLRFAAALTAKHSPETMRKALDA